MGMGQQLTLIIIGWAQIAQSNKGHKKMNWFKNLFTTISNFFKMASKTAIGIAAADIGEFAMEIVEDLHIRKDLKGYAKRTLAVNAIRSQYPDIQTAAINLAIETAWAIISDRMGKSK